MELTDDEVKVLNEWFLKSGWVDRDWKHADDIDNLRKKVRDEVTKINYNKVFTGDK